MSEADYLESQGDGGYAWDCLMDNLMTGSWTERDGITTHKISNMTDSHLRNTISHLERQGYPDTATEDVMSQFAGMMREELDDRNRGDKAHIRTESSSKSTHSSLAVRYKAAYDVAKAAPIGSQIKCPVCSQTHKKTTYHKIFDTNGKTKKNGNCKDKYWNVVEPSRRERAKHYKGKRR